MRGLWRENQAHAEAAPLPVCQPVTCQAEMPPARYLRAAHHSPFRYTKK